MSARKLIRSLRDALRLVVLLVVPGDKAAAQGVPVAPGEHEREPELAHGVPEDLWEPLAELRDNVLLPAIAKRRIGQPAYMDIRKAIPRYKYAARHQLLALLDAGQQAVRGRFRGTEYFQDQCTRAGSLAAAIKLLRYSDLLWSIRRRGLEPRWWRPDGVPCFFCAQGIYFRLDGTHRASVARYLGYQRLPVRVVTPAEALQLESLTSDQGQLLESLQAPLPDHAESIQVSMEPSDVARVIESRRDWYQEVDFGTGTSTNTIASERLGRARHRLRSLIHRLFDITTEKNATIMSALPDLTGLRVLDIGCNAGLYSCYASMRGAAHVLGIDRNPRWLEQAREVASTFRALGRVTEPIDFRVASINDHLELLADVDVVMANCVLYHLGPIDRLVDALRRSEASILIIQCNTVRDRDIGKKNRPGVDGYEAARKTWGNVLATVDGASVFVDSCGFAVEKVTEPRSQYAVVVARR